MRWSTSVERASRAVRRIGGIDHARVVLLLMLMLRLVHSRQLLCGCSGRSRGQVLERQELLVMAVSRR